MTPNGKKALIISISLLAIGGVVGYIFWKKAKDKKDAQAKADAEAKRIADEQAQGGGGNVGGGNVGGGNVGGGNVGGGTITLSNFEALQKNLNIKGKNGAVAFMFDSGKYKASFYDNNRFAITGQGGYLKKGNYSNGGLTLVVDGGKTIKGTSVYTNLLNASK